MCEQGWSRQGRRLALAQPPCPQAVCGVLWGGQRGHPARRLLQPAASEEARASEPLLWRCIWQSQASGTQSHTCHLSPTRIQGQEERELEMV